MNTVITKIVAGVFLGLFALTVSAQSNDVRESFKEVASISMKDIVVPSVVEVQLDTFIERNEFAVYDRSKDVYVPYWYNTQYTQVPVVLSVETNQRDTAKVLIDGLYTTSVDFPLPDAGQGVAEIVLSGNTPVTSSELVFSFAQNVARPLTVSLVAVDEYGETKTVVAQKPMTSNRLLFPETTASTWRIQFTYAQPLRVSEVVLVQSGVEKNISRTIRFLAQPDSVYDIFINPDRRVVVTTLEAGDLKNNENIFFVQTPVTGVENILYTKADSDNDGVEDVVDNCVSLANEDQIDKDNNGRGDACDDFDRDGRINSIDNCPNDPNRRQEDEDGDGVGDVCDSEESRITEKYVWIPWVGLGFAALVMITMFVVLLRRPEEGDESDSSKEVGIKDEESTNKKRSSIAEESKAENN